MRLRSALSLQDGKRLPGDSFTGLLPLFREELGFTYGPLIREHQLQLRLLAEDRSGKQVGDWIIEPLEPEWEEDGQVMPKALYDLGGGELKLSCKYGQIVPSEKNNRYYRGNMASSGVEIRINGRAVDFGLFKSIWKCEKHPSQNRFLVQINLETDCAAAVPATRTAKNGFREGDARLEALCGWIRCSVPKPDRMTPAAVERELVCQLANEKKRLLQEPCRVSLEEYAFQSLGEKIRMDLLTTENGFATIYEGKKDTSQPKDVYQLRMYWDGCVVDGIPVQEAILVASRHTENVRRVVDLTNGMCGPDGRPYNFLLATWQDEGINYPVAV